MGGGIAPVDVIIGGSPCQDLSIAGKRAGLSGERSNLFMEQIRIIKEMHTAYGANSPRYMIWENVPGALSSNKGEDFRVVLESIINIKEPNAIIPQPPNEKWNHSGCIMGAGWSVAWRILDAQFWGVPQRRRRIALVADFGGQSAPEILFERKGLSRDSQKSGETRQGITKNPKRSIGTANQGDVGISSSFNGYNSCLTGDITSTIGVSCGMSTGRNGIVQQIYDCRGNGDGKTAPTITGDHNSRVTDYTSIVFENNSFGGYKRGIGALKASGGDNGGGSETLVVKLKQAGFCVRRLTPLECERLQGFPDGWTDIGNFITTTGKRRTSSDTVRYKALGNSIALPPWRYVLSKLCSQYSHHVTMGSLFDGIGGFPLIWEKLNGKSSCLWASEIEEFPIAVTKYHF